MSEKNDILRHLNDEHTEPVRDPIWSHIYLPPSLLGVIDTAAVQQLHRIRQLGPSYLVYPGATHTRLNHSLGVFHVAKRMIARLMQLPDVPYLTLDGVKSFLAAALLHDVGHFPYTHSFKSLPLADHEHLTGAIVQEGELASRLRNDYGVDPAHVAAIVDPTIPLPAGGEIALYRAILSGSLDPDKLDYLNRDAYFCGVPYGIQDTDYAFSRIIPNGYEGIGLGYAGLSAMENILFSKYLMYRAVYWHRTVRAATAMIKTAIYLGLQEGAVTAEDLYGLDDEMFLTDIGARRFPPFALIQRVGNRKLLKPVADVAFDAARHGPLAEMASRRTIEGEIARDLSRRSGRTVADFEVILDVPDPVSFESRTPIFHDGAFYDFAELSVFTPAVVERFTTTLRRIRLMIPPETASCISEPLRYLEDFIRDAV